MTAKGRKNNPKNRFQDTVVPGSAEQAILEKQDQMIDMLKALTAKLDADGGVTDTNYASTLTDSLSKVALK
jgi:hypothetical protein